MFEMRSECCGTPTSATVPPKRVWETGVMSAITHCTHCDRNTFYVPSIGVTVPNAYCPSCYSNVTLTSSTKCYITCIACEMRWDDKGKVLTLSKEDMEEEGFTRVQRHNPLL